MTTLIQQSLKSFWFSEKEIAVYTTLLKLTSAPVSTLARHTWIKRVSVYPVVEWLIKKWVAKEHVNHDGKYFSVIAPQELCKKQQKKVDKLHEAVPLLVQMMGNFSNKPLLQYYEWIDGIKKIYEDMLTSQEDIRAFLGIKDMNQELNEYLNEVHIPARIKNKVRARVLLANTPSHKQLYGAHHDWPNNQKELYTESKSIAHDSFVLWNEIDLYGPDKVAVVLYNQGELSGFIIESKTLYESLRSLFDLARSATN